MKIRYPFSMEPSLPFAVYADGSRGNMFSICSGGDIPLGILSRIDPGICYAVDRDPNQTQTAGLKAYAITKSDIHQYKNFCTGRDSSCLGDVAGPGGVYQEIARSFLELARRRGKRETDKFHWMHDEKEYARIKERLGQNHFDTKTGDCMEILEKMGNGSIGFFYLSNVPFWLKGGDTERMRNLIFEKGIKSAKVIATGFLSQKVPKELDFLTPSNPINERFFDETARNTWLYYTGELV